MKLKRVNFYSVIFYTLIFFLYSSLMSAQDELISLQELCEKSNAVVIGTVSNLTITYDEYLMFFYVEDSIKDKIEEMQIRIKSQLNSGFYLPDEVYLEDKQRYLLFLKKENDDFWTITGGYFGVFDVDYFKDIKLILEEYKNDSELFSGKNIKKLIQIFENTEMVKIKTLLLNELEKNMDVENLYYLDKFFEYENEAYKIFSIKNYGKYKVESKRENIEKTLLTSNNSNIIFYSIIALGEIKNNKSFEVIKQFLRNTDQGIRRAAIETLGKINDKKIIEPLIECYTSEKDFGNRIAIITSIEMLGINDDVKKAFEYLKSLEQDPFVFQFILKRL